MTVEELRLILRINGTSTYTHSLNEVTNVTNNYTNSIGGLTSMLAKFVSAGFIAKFAKDCIEAASNLQEVSNVMNVTFGQNAQIIEQWAKTQAASFGLSEKAAKDYTGLYGTMAKQFGVSLDRATKMSIELTKLTGDVASFYNTTDKIASTKLKSIFTGETESLKELGVVMTEANLNAYAMSKGLGKTVKQMSEQEKVLLRYSFVTEKLQHAQGDFARTSDGWANSVRLLKLRFENLKIEIGNQLLPVAGYALNTISNGIVAISKPLVVGATYIRLYVEAWKRASDETKNFLKIGIGIFAIGMLIPKIIEIGAKAIAIFKAGMAALTINAITLGTALKWMFGIAGVALSLVAFKRLSDSIKSIKAEEATNELEALGDTSAIASNAVDGLADGMDGLGDATKELENFLAPFDEVNKIGNNGSLMSNLITSGDLENILEASNSLDDINSIIDEINRSSINPNFDMGFELPEWLTTEWWDGYFNYLKEWFSSGQWKKDMWNMLEGFNSSLNEWFPSWTDFWDKRGQDVYDIIQKVKEKFQALVDDIKIILGYGEEADETGVSGLTATGKKHYLEAYAKQSTGWKPSTYAAGGLPNKGSVFIAGESGVELVSNFGGSQTKVVNQSQINNNSQPTIAFTPTIMIDGRKITSVVVDDINNTTRSTGNSPLIQMG